MHPPLFAHSRFLYLHLAQRFDQIPTFKSRRLALKFAKNNRLEERKADLIKLWLTTIH
jgi:hypothetical protein